MKCQFVEKLYAEPSSVIDSSNSKKQKKKKEPGSRTQYSYDTWVIFPLFEKL